MVVRSEFDSPHPDAQETDALRTENLRLTQRGATDRALSDAAWAARLSGERVRYEETCARLVAEHQTWYARFVQTHDKTCSKLAAEHAAVSSALLAGQAALAAAEAEIAALRQQLVTVSRDSVLLRDILRSSSWRATLPLRVTAGWVRRLFGGT